MCFTFRLRLNPHETCLLINHANFTKFPRKKKFQNLKHFWF